MVHTVADRGADELVDELVEHVLDVQEVLHDTRNQPVDAVSSLSMRTTQTAK